MRLVSTFLVVCLVFVASMSFASDCSSGQCPLRQPIKAAKAVVREVRADVKEAKTFVKEHREVCRKERKKDCPCRKAARRLHLRKRCG